MKKIVLGALLIALAGSTAAFAQGGAATGAATGAVGGAIVGGPAGAAVGATVGAVAGGIADDSRPRFRTYVTADCLGPTAAPGMICTGSTKLAAKLLEDRS